MISASSVEISFFEIYNERIHDLLTDDPKPKKTKDAFAFGPKSPYIRPSLKIRGTEENIFVDGLSWHTITSADEAEKWLAKGNAKRATASTGNVYSYSI